MESSDSFFEFGPYRVVASERVLLRDGQPVSLTPKAFDTLLVLVRNSGHLVDKDKLMGQVWPETWVEEANITQNIFTLRRVLGESGKGLKYIETVPRRGYRFVASVREVGGDESVLTSANSGSIQKATKTEDANLPTNSLAVLPFLNASVDPKAENLSEGIAESLINSLSQLPQLRVMARSAVIRYEGRELDLKEIGRELGVRWVLVGRVHLFDNKLIIGTELVDVANGWRLWGQKYARQMQEILEVQVEIAQHVSDALRIKLTADEQQRLAKKYTANLDAYHNYVKGRYYWSRYTRDGLTKAVWCFQQAIDLDPTYALAYAGLADSYFRLATSYLPPKEALPKARAAAMQALEIDDTLPEAYASLGMVKMRYDWDWEGAEKAFKRAIELKPSYATAHQWYANYLDSLGRFDEAQMEMKSALDLDPLSMQIQVSLAALFWKMNRPELAMGLLKGIIEMDPSFQPAHLLLGLAYEQLGDFSKSIAELLKATELGQTSITRAFLGRAYALSGRKRKAKAVIDELEKQAKENYVSAYNVSLLYAALGENDAAFIWLERAYEERDEFLTWLETDPRVASLRADKRFNDMITRVGFKS